MSGKVAKSASSKSKKQAFDPFVRFGAYTAPLPAQGNAPAPQTVFPAEFIDSSLIITPALPRTEAQLRIQFRCTVDLVQGDAVTIHLPGFKGPKPRVFSLETVPHPDGLNSARSFAAYWVGEGKPKKVKGVVGTPPKQSLVLRCLRRIEENTLVSFAVPLALGLVTPEKLAANSAKVKLEGNAVRHAEGGKVTKQPFLASTGLKKTPVVEELETYAQVMAGLVEGGGLGKEDRLIAEELLLEDVEQLSLAVTTTLLPTSSPAYQSQQQQPPCRQRPYPVSMPWPIAQRVFHTYEDAGAFVKAVMEHAIAFIKKHDHLAVHREVAANWGVKVGAVVVLEDLLAMQYGAMYPGVSRTALLVAHLLTMEPVDVARTFPVTKLPAYSLQQELVSAFRMQDTLTAVDPTGSACGIPSRCEALLQKWSAVLSVLLTAVMPVSADMAADPSAAVVADDDDDDDDDVDAGTGEGDANSKRTAARVRFTTPAGPDAASRAQAAAVLLMAPPPLFTGLRELPHEELQSVRDLREGDWYVFPSLTVAQQKSPAPSLTAAASAEPSTVATAEATVGVNKGKGNGAAAGADKSGGGGDDDDDDASAIPDNAVLFEIRRSVEGLELADLSLYPLSRQWLLPFSSSFRVVSVTVREDLNDLTHVVLDMVGSLVGEVADADNMPEGDRAIARMVVRKLRIESENSESKTPYIARLAYLHVRRNDRRRLHPPTLMRAQYVAHFQEVKRASEAKQTIEDGTVQWQIRVHAAQMLDDGVVVKPAVWEPLLKKYAPAVEQFFLGRTRTKCVLEDNGLVVDFAKMTADYSGKGPRPIRRLVHRRITHEPNLEEGVVPYDETQTRLLAMATQIAVLNGKLGLAPNGQPLAAPSTTASASATEKNSKKAARNGAKRAAPVTAA